MIEAYKIQATLNLAGNAYERMQKFSTATINASNQVTKLQKLTKSLNNLLLTTGTTLAVINPKVATLATKIAQVTGKMGPMNNAISNYNDKISSAETRTEKYSSRLENLRMKLNFVTASANRAANSFSNMTQAANTGRLPRVAVGGAGGGGRSGGIGNALYGFAAGAAGVHHVGPIAAGIATAALIGSSFKTGTEYQQEMGLAVSQGIPGLTRESIENYLNKTSVIGTSKLDLLKLVTDAAIITKTKEGAFGVAPTLAKMKYIGKTRGLDLSGADLQAAIKTVEIVSGSKDPDVLNRYLESMTKIMISTGGRIKPEQFQSIVRSARGYAAGLDPDFFFNMLEPLIQEFGTRTGPMLATFGQHILAGRMTTQAASLLRNGGLIKPASIIKDDVGRIIGIQNKAIVGADLAAKYPTQWIEQYLMPFFERIGAKTYQEKVGIAGRIFTNTDLALVLTYLKQKEKFEISLAANRRIGGLDQQIAAVQGTNADAIVKLAAAFSDLKLALDNFDNPVTHGAIWLLTEFIKNTTTTLEVLNHPIDIIGGAAKELVKPGGIKSMGNLIAPGSGSLFAGSMDFLGLLKKEKKQGQSPADVSVAKSANGQMVRTQINIDGRKVADAISPGLTSAVEKSTSYLGSTSQFNTSLGLQPNAYNGAGVL